MQKNILKHSLSTISWIGDEIIDWSNPHETYSLSGAKKRFYNYYLAFPFDSCVQSENSEYVFVFQKLGTKGLLMKNGKILREINRSYYQAHVYEYPAIFLTHKDKTYLVHCPTQYCQLDFEEVETGNIVTNIKGRDPGDIFHSRLEISPDGKYLMSKGWVWHPLDIIQIYEIANCLENPALLDKLDFENPDAGVEVCTASFIDDNKALLGSTAEVFDSEKQTPLLPNSFCIWNIPTNIFSTPITPAFEFGNLFAINTNLAWDIYKFPKIINLNTGEIEDKAEDVYSGEQRSSILHTSDKQPLYAFDKTRKSLAILQNDQITVLTRQ
jgi:hypothetical protein